MYGSHRNSGIHSLANYNEAIHKWESTKPIRGRAEDVRPLGNRRQADQYKIEVLPEGGVACILYRTPVVTFLGNGDVLIKHDGWNSQSTCHFIDEVLWEVRSRIYANNLLISLKDKPSEEFTIPEGGLFLRRNEQGGFTATNVKAHVVHVIDRKGANNVRARYADFTNYVSRMCRLKGNSLYLMGDMKEVFGLDKVGNPALPCNLANNFYNEWVAGVKTFHAWIADTNAETKNDSYYKALLHMAWSFGNQKWDGSKTTGYVLHEKKAMTGFDTVLIGLHRSEILKEKVLPLGVVRRDSYGTFFRQGWRRLYEEAV
jgi:hypothetical protein